MRYFGELAAERRANPQDDLLSALVMVEEEGDKLNEDELFGSNVVACTGLKPSAKEMKPFGLRWQNIYGIIFSKNRSQQR